ncbi:MAG: hypothetical protein ABJE66_06365 [Deltaproteobacteria bacterium]
MPTSDRRGLHRRLTRLALEARTTLSMSTTSSKLCAMPALTTAVGVDLAGLGDRRVGAHEQREPQAPSRHPE